MFGLLLLRSGLRSGRLIAARPRFTLLRWPCYAIGMFSRRNPDDLPPSGATPRVARVLVIDDEPAIGKCMEIALADEFHVTTTTKPIEALQWLTSGDWYDVILCDLMMPTLNGFELRQRVYDWDPELAARIVFVTGGLLRPEVQRLLEDVPNTVLAKPFEVDALRDLIRRRTARVSPPQHGSQY